MMRVIPSARTELLHPEDCRGWKQANADLANHESRMYTWLFEFSHGCTVQLAEPFPVSEPTHDSCDLMIEPAKLCS